MRKWNGVSYVRAGWSHDQAQLPCQDAVYVKETEHYLLAAVADGVGSLPNSHIASNAAVEAVDKWFGAKLRELKRRKYDLSWVAHNLIHSVRDALNTAAKHNGISLASMDCNLAFVFVMPDDYALFGSLGDCAVCVIGRDSRVMTSASDLANGTDTVLTQNSEMRLRIEGRILSDDSIQGFLLTTDGLEGEVYYKNSEVLRKRAEAYVNALLTPGARAQIEYLTGQLPETFDDDIGIAVLSCSTRPITLPDDPSWLCTCEARNPISASRCGNCGADFVELYKNIVQGKDREAFFVTLNRRPNEERKRLGLPPLKTEILPPKLEQTNGTRRQQGAAVKNTGENAENIERLIANMTGGEGSMNHSVLGGDRRGRIHGGFGREDTDELTGPDDEARLRPRRSWKKIALGAAAAVLVLLVTVIVLLVWMLRSRGEIRTLKAENARFESLMEHEYAGGILKGVELMEELGCDASELYEVSAALAFVWEEPGDDGEAQKSLREGDVVRADTSRMEYEAGGEGVCWVRITMRGGMEGWCQRDQLQPWLSGGQS